MSIFDFLFEKKGCSAKQHILEPPSLPKQTAPVNWRVSDAHLFLLSRFRHGQDPVNIAPPPHWEGMWQKALNEAPQQVIERFITEGILVPVTLAGKLNSVFKATEIKEFLRAQGLPVSGRKDEGIERLVKANSQEMATKVAHLNVYECSPEVRTMVDSFIRTQEEAHRAAEKLSLEQLRAKDFGGASLTVSQFEAGKVFPRGIDSRSIAENLKLFVTYRPKILNGLAENEWEPLGIATAMMLLWGTNKASQWLPEGFVGLSKFDNDTSARLMFFHWRHQSDMMHYRKDINWNIKHVQIIGGNNSCLACEKIRGGIYTFDKAPELPYEQCTHEKGCGCQAVPIRV